MTSDGPTTGVLEELRSLLEAEGGPLAAALGPAAQDPRDPDVFASLAAGGRRASSDPRGYALVVESVFEGYLLHYRCGRIVQDADPDLRLLAGDHLYAFGLARLASIGDLEAVDELADLISLCAQAHTRAGAGRDSPWRLTGALWASSVLAVAGGSWPAHEEAKRGARERGAKVIEKVLDAASERAQELGLAPRLEHALIAFQRAVEAELSTT
jgi:hypothetical protein